MEIEKISQRLQEACNHSTDGIPDVRGYGIDNLSATQLKAVEAVLIDHFKFDRVHWMNRPVEFVEDRKAVVTTAAMVLSDINLKYKGQVGYVWRIVFSPKMYDPEKMHIPVKDGCVFAPVIVSSDTFKPLQSITLTWSPEDFQDLEAVENSGKDLNQRVRDLLEKVLTNPEDYRPQPFVRCMLRFAVA